MENVKITIAKDGPYLVDGEVEIVDASGNTIKKDNCALCRCGASKDKPFCDGSHNVAGFKG